MSKVCSATLLRHGQFEFLLVANCSTIQVLDFPSNRLIDTLHGHNSAVKAIDASFTGTIVSISEANEVCFHVPTAAETLKWDMVFKTKMMDGLDVSAVKISTIGDLCVMAGDRYISVWTQDTGADSYTQQIFYSGDQDTIKNQMGQIVEHTETLKQRVKQLEITGDARMFLTLEENANSLKVWHQTFLHSAPSKDVKSRMYRFDELSIYETPQQAQIDSFRVKFKSPNSYMAEPCILMTLSKYQINMYVESLMDTEMRFVCVQTIKVSPRCRELDAVFIPQKIHCHPAMAQHPVLPWYLSKIFDTHRDEELKMKQQKGDLKYGLAPAYQNSQTGAIEGHAELDSFTFFVMEDSCSISLYKAQGISNAPMRNYSIELLKKVKNDTLQVSLTQVIACVLQPQSQGQFKMVCQSEKGHIMLTNFDTNQCSVDVLSSYALESTQSEILFSKTHPQFTQLLALVHKDEIVVFYESQLLGKLPQCSDVKDLIWLPKLNQMLVMKLNREGKLIVELVSSSWLLKGQKPMDKPQVQELDIYQVLHFVSLNQDTIGLEVVSFTQQDDQVSLQFATLQKNGASMTYTLNYNLQVDASQAPKVEQIDSKKETRFYANPAVTSNLVMTNHTKQAAYFLILTERQLGGRAQAIEQCLMFFKVTKQSGVEEMWKCEVTVRHEVTAKLINETIVVSIVEGEYGKCHYVLYMYCIKECRYLGYLKLSEMLGLPHLKGLQIEPMDFEQSQNFRTITVLAGDKAYLLKEKHGLWTVEQSQQFSTYTYQSLKIRGQVTVLENHFVVKTPDLETIKYSSLPLYHPTMLKSFFFKGYAKQVCQILNAVYMHFQDVQKNPLPDLSSVKFEEDKPAPVVKKPFNAFDAFDESESEEDDILAPSAKKKEEEKQDDFKLLNERFDELLDNLVKSNCPLRLSKEELFIMVEFLHQFRPLVKMDFYCDKLATHVLLQVYLETEKCNQSKMEGAKIMLGLVESSFEKHQREIETGEKKKEGFDDEAYIANLMGQANVKTEVDQSKFGGWSSTQVCMALYSENQDVILDSVAQRLNFEESLTWGIMRKLSIPLWLKSDAKLRQLIEKVAKNEYRLFVPDGHQSKPEYSALWYVLTGKQEVLKKLFDFEADGKNYVRFLQSNFSEEKPRKVAGKNAMALVSKRKNLLACAFYILGQDLASAVQVALERCNDPLLALVICRCNDPQNEKKQIDLIAKDHFIKRGKQFNDPYLKSIGQWLLKEYVKAVNELTPTKISSHDQLFKEVKEFNLEFQKPEIKTQEQNQAKNIVKDQVEEFPKTSQNSYESLDLLTRLRKVPEVKRLLNKDWQLDKKSKAGGGMFDDLLGSDEESEEEEVVEEKEVISVNETFLLESILETLLESGHTSLAQILIKENLSIQMSTELKQKIASIQITDVMLIPHVKSEMISASMTQLQEQLGIGVDMNFVVKQFTALENLFDVEIEFLVQSGASLRIVQQMIEKESQPLARFVKTSSMYCGRLVQADDRDSEGSKKLKKIAELVQSISDSLIQTQLLKNVDVEQPQTSTIKQSPAPKLIDTSKKPQKTQDYFAAWDDDEDEEEDFSKPNEEESAPNLPSTSHVTQSSKFVASSIQDKLNELTFKCKMGVLLSSALFQLCLMINKFSLLPDIVSELTEFLKAWNWSAATVTESEVQKNIEKIQFLNVLKITLQVMTSIKKNINHADQLPKPKIRRKANKYQFIEHQDCYDFFAMWLKHNCAYGLQNMVLHNGSRILGKHKFATQASIPGGRMSQIDLLDNGIEVRNGFMPGQLAKLLQDQFEQYEKAAVFKFQYNCNAQQRQGLVTDLQAYMAREQFETKVNMLDLRYFIRSIDKLKQFCKLFVVKKYMPQLLDLNLSSLPQINDVERSQEPLEKNGIELFRQRGEPIADFCVKGDSLGIALHAKGMREISITCSLGFRCRTAQFDLVDEELFNWFDCLHRFDQIMQYQIEPTSDTIRQALLSHQMKKSISSIVMSKPTAASMQGQEQKMWDGLPESAYMKQVSGLDITHEDFSSAICEHPHLPVYLTGNAKGLVCMWHFNQVKNQSLNQWILEPDVAPRDASAKKSTVKKIQFTHYGDKFVSLNAEGSLFLHSFDLSGDHDALFVYKGHKISDFGLLEEDGTVIAAFSHNNKALVILDCMTGETLAQAKVQGTQIQVDAQRQCIYVFNFKSGYMQKFDLNLQCQFTRQLGREDITSSVLCGHHMRSLMVGFSDGLIKVYDANEVAAYVEEKHKNNDRHVEEKAWCGEYTIPAFVSVGGRKGAVTQLKVHAESGAVYGASSQGNIKMLRLSM